MIRRLIKIALFLFIALLLLVGIFLLCLDPITKAFLESQIRYQTGLEARIGHVKVGLLAPTITIEDLRLNNTAEFAGTPCLVLKELHLEYDRDAMQNGRLHFPLVRLNLDEIDVVRTANGRSNFDDLENREKEVLRTADPKTGKNPQLRFAGIDRLNLSLGRARVIYLSDPSQNTSVDFHLQNEVFTNLTSEDDLRTIEAYLALRTGGALVLQGLLGLPPKYQAAPPNHTPPRGK